MRRIILAAALAAASVSYALAPAAFAETADPSATFGTGPDPAGVDELGVNITGVNLTPSGVQAFFAQQSPETQREIMNACHTYDTHPTGAGEQTLSFCANLGKA
jgi:hypothetical protein